MNRITLFHGSRGGIDGEIVPKSRNRCDFGCGFYMGTNPDQAKSLVANDASPYFYTVSLNLENIPQDRKLVVDGLDWAFLVLYNRGRLDSIKGTELYDSCKQMMLNKDIIVGPIADDSINEVMKRFMDSQITDKAFIESIKAIDYGIQYVAKTEFACSQIKILTEQELDGDELERATQIAFERRREGSLAAQKMQLEYRNVGSYLDEIIEEAQRHIAPILEGGNINRNES